MSLTPSSLASGEYVLELRIEAPAAAEHMQTPSQKSPTLIHLNSDLTSDQLNTSVHVLTETFDRTTWTNQLQLFTNNPNLPEHLPARLNVGVEEVLQLSLEMAPSSLILISNNKLNEEIQQSVSRASEFFTRVGVIKPTDYIELTDALNDVVRDLKQKTLVKLKIQIELQNETDSLEALTYIPEITKSGNSYFINLIDLASDQEKAYTFKTNSHQARVSFSYEDLILSRRILGGQQVDSQY
jgi:hypothetical protein